MNFTLIRNLTCGLVLLGATLSALAQEDPALFLGRGNARVARAQAYPNRWEGPISGPAGAHKKFVVLIAADLRDKGATRLVTGVKEAIGVIGWNLQVVDCYGLPGRRAEAFSRALALKPDGIIFAGADAAKQTRELAAAAKMKVPVVGWHAAARPGPAEGLYTNLGTDPREVGQIAAMYGVVESKGRAGVVLFVDSSTANAAAKATEMADLIKQCQTCSLLSVEEAPLTETPAVFQARVVALSKKFANRWTHILATNDQYFDLLKNPSADAAAAVARLQGIGAGDGSESAYQRIRARQLQIGTIPEPLSLQGWQLVDELNRAIVGDKPSGFVSPAYLVTSENTAFHSGQRNTFDPGTAYRDEYRKIWSK